MIYYTRLVTTFIFFVFMCTWLWSCERTYDYTYYMANGTDSTIQVHVKTFKDDSTFQILPGKNQLLFVKDHGIEGSRGPFYGDVNEDILFISVVRDSAISVKDYRSNKWWMYKKGVYQAVVDKNDF